MHHFSYSDLKIVQMTKVQGQDIHVLTDIMKSLCQMLASIHFPLQNMT